MIGDLKNPATLRQHSANITAATDIQRNLGSVEPINIEYLNIHQAVPIRTPTKGEGEDTGQDLSIGQSARAGEAGSVMTEGMWVH